MSEDVLTCQKHKLKQFLTGYLYPNFLQNFKKRQTLWNGFALLENDITGSEPTLRFKIYSRYQRSDN
jgi:hypothetical protein